MRPTLHENTRYSSAAVDEAIGEKGHVWRINGNLVFPWILSLSLNERSLFLSRVNRLQIW